MSPRRRWGAALSALAVSAATFVVATLLTTATPAQAAGTGVGYLHTNGNKLVDSTGATVRLTGINWFGMETDNRTFHGLWSNQTWKSQIDHMAQLGYNTIRVPYSGDALKSGATATGINDYVNPDLVGNSPLQILDKVIAYAGQKGMRILLDRHRPSAAGQTPLWYTAAVSEASMIADWQMLAQRYAGNSTVIGGDLFNEPHAEGTDPSGTGACWGCGDTARDWRLAAQRIGNAILSVNSNWLIVVEGVSCPSGGSPNVWDSVPDDPMTCDWWGGNLAGAAQYPVQLNTANRLVYSAHDYGISVYDRQPWFKDASFPENLPAVWDHFWGYLYKNNTAPVLVGEFGSTLANPLDVQWLTKLMSYMGTGVNGISFTYWAWNPNSGDTGGIVSDDWVTVNTQKQNIVGPYLIAPVGSGATSSPTSSASTSPSSSTSPSASTSPTGGSGTGSCSVTYKVDSSWPQGFNATVTVRNTGTATVNNWVATLTLPSGVSLVNGWNATVTASGQTLTAAAPTWAPNLAAGASVSFNFQANGPSSPTPSGYKLNGVACSV
ncbi:endoglucanase [Hamadaea flava]|uniref:Endoglucanase n=1 Tax=Hamadaea flava TaxID=1742688 RepID=A0ABV8LL45_9ACTN|nr:cellulase family glycosylhydrolase [Hamadaea flava]MCP2323777.1 endoglucanase [Hamadaea flava]